MALAQMSTARPRGGADAIRRATAATKVVNAIADSTASGDELLREGKLEEAVQAYDKALKADAHNARAYGQRALAFIKLGMGMKALKDAEMYMQMMPGKVCYPLEWVVRSASIPLCVVILHLGAD